MPSTPSTTISRKQSDPAWEKKRNRGDDEAGKDKLQELHQQVENSLVEGVNTNVLNVAFIGCSVAAFISYLSGAQEWKQAANPGAVFLCGLIVRQLDVAFSTQMTILLSVMAFSVLRHALFFQGCSACVVPALYGFIPGAIGFIYRTPRAVAISTALCMVAILMIFIVDLTGNCPSQPIDPDDTPTIIADRLVPLLMLIFGNSGMLTVILRQSQESSVLHAKAIRSAIDMADMRKDILHRVTHELRTPLNGLVGSVELLTASETIAQTDMENVHTIQRCLASILDICDDVLAAAKTNHATEEKHFCLASCVDAVAETFAATAHKKGIELKVAFIGDTKAVVRGMEVKLRQVLFNLVGNAIKFTDSGSIAVRVHAKEDKNQMLQCAFQVEDTGVGIDSKDANMLFEPFHQGEKCSSAVSRSHQGTGLGLTICRDLVEMMGGTIEVDGERGKGSRFHFSLRLKRERSTASTTNTARSNETNDRSPASASCIIAIVDSQQESLESCRSVVKSIAPPSADVITTASLDGLVDRTIDKCNDAYESRIAFVEYDPADPNFSVALSRIRKAGWDVLVYSSRGDFAEAVKMSTQFAYAVFRRPLPLVRLGNRFNEALNGAAKTTMTSSEYPAENNTGTSSDHSHSDAANTGSSSPPEKKEDLGKLDGGVQAERSFQDLQSKQDPSTRVVVVDDTPLNVKLLARMLGRLTTMPVVSFYDGQSAINLVKTSPIQDTLLVYLDWHMPILDGVSTAELIREVTRARSGPRVYLCMVTADVDGLYAEIERRELTYRGSISNSLVSIQTEYSTSSVVAVLDLVAGKPLTLKTIEAILEWFSEQNQDSQASKRQMQTR